MFFKTVSLLFVMFLVVFLHSVTVSADDAAQDIHTQCLTLDSHVDTPLLFLRSGYDLGRRHSADSGKVDLVRMQQGGLDAIFFAAYVGQGERSPDVYRKARERIRTLIDAIHQAINQYSDRAAIALGPEQVYRLEKQGKSAILIGIENGYAIGRDIESLDSFYQRGVRYMTLCHSRNNDICDSSTDPDGAEHQGLSAFGKKVVDEMNRLGMIIDVSHASDASVYDVCEFSRAPVIASHSCARALRDHPRNLDDDCLTAIAGTGGVIQVCFLTDYLVAEKNPQRHKALARYHQKYADPAGLTESQKQRAREEYAEIDKRFPPFYADVSDLVDHIDHIVAVVGIDHVGIGSDFDGGGHLRDCRDVSEILHITRELLARGYDAESVRKIWGENFLRVYRQAVHAAAKDSSAGKKTMAN